MSLGVPVPFITAGCPCHVTSIPPSFPPPRPSELEVTHRFGITGRVCLFNPGGYPTERFSTRSRGRLGPTISHESHVRMGGGDMNHQPQVKIRTAHGNLIRVVAGVTELVINRIGIVHVNI